MSLSTVIAQHLPFLRRYARALTGSQASGDNYVRACLEAIVDSVDQLNLDLTPRVALYRLFHVIWTGTQLQQSESATATGDRPDMMKRLEALTPERRQALLLTTMEGFSVAEAAVILNVDVAALEKMVDAAIEEIVTQQPTLVLIIEDEPVISLDLCSIVTEMGHTVAAVAATRAEAVAAAHRSPPGLVLADIQLADNSSGIDAVRDILQSMSAPVIFITAYPERLLTGERPEPTFLVTKPFVPETIKVAIAQALFLSSER